MKPMTSRSRRLLTAVAVTAALLPAAPALAQTATHTPAPSTTPAVTPASTPVRPQIAVTAQTIDFGDTVVLSARGTPGQVVDLYSSAARFAPRVIRTTTLDATGTASWTLQPGETTSFFVQPRGTTGASDTVTVAVRRTVTIGVNQANGVYTFTGTIARAVPGVQVTIARLDADTDRVTGVASTRTVAGGRYEIRTSLPPGFAGYYALTEPTSDLLAGRSRLYGLIVNVRPGQPTVTDSVSLDVRLLGEYYVFSGRVSPGRAGVPVTLGRLVDGRLVGVLGARTGTGGSWSLSVPLGPGTYFFQAVTATAKSRTYGLVVPASVAPQGVARPLDVDCADFDTQREAQAFHDRYFAQFGDFGRLDADDDGRACEDLP